MVVSALLASLLMFSGAQASQPASVTQSSAPVVLENPDQINLKQGGKPPSKQKEPGPVTPEVTTGEPVRTGDVRQQRNAAKLYLKGVRLLEGKDAAC